MPTLSTLLQERRERERVIAEAQDRSSAELLERKRERLEGQITANVMAFAECVRNWAVHGEQAHMILPARAEASYTRDCVKFSTRLTEDQEHPYLHTVVREVDKWIMDTPQMRSLQAECGAGIAIDCFQGVLHARATDSHGCRDRNRNRKNPLG